MARVGLPSFRNWTAFILLVALACAWLAPSVRAARLSSSVVLSAAAAADVNSAVIVQAGVDGPAAGAVAEDGLLSLSGSDVALAVAGMDADAVDQRLLAAEFDQFQVEHGRRYASEEERRLRMAVFAENRRLVSSRNAANLPYTLKLNEFADMTWREFAAGKLGALQNCSATVGNHRLVGRGDPSTPRRRDWRREGIVSPVKNQGHCGSCWTFSTTGALEAAYTQKTGKRVSLSEQQLVDCAQRFNNHGCNGGLPSQAFEYVKYNGGLDTESGYPYEGKDDTCHFQPSAVGVTVTDVVNITEYDEEGLKDAVAFVRPVSIAFQVVDDFRFYHRGVYQSDTCRGGPETVNHAVLAVGYDASHSPPYWIVKNSWGEAWGDRGYFKIRMGANMCGLAACASYPVV